MKKNILLIFGGGGSEHEISAISQKYIHSKIDLSQNEVFTIEIRKDQKWFYNEKEEVYLSNNKELRNSENKVITKVDYVIPCIHGYPGETGDLQSYLEMNKIPYLGCNSETSKICFNKALTKLWLDKVGIATTPFIMLSSLNDQTLKEAIAFYDKYQSAFIKATNQGSSVGCYPVSNREQIEAHLKEAFTYSDYVIIEEQVSGRELEVATFDYQGKVYATSPGEIVCPSKFYSYEEKYNNSSKTQTHVLAKDLSEKQKTQIIEMAEGAFKSLRLKDLSRIDFFLTDDGRIYINEINTFPGHTPISMFPMMMENVGIKYEDFLADRIAQSN